MNYPAAELSGYQKKSQNPGLGTAASCGEFTSLPIKIKNAGFYILYCDAVKRNFPAVVWPEK
jgi:hypothetical protein